MPTGFEMDQLTVQKAIANNLAEVGKQLIRLNKNLERIADLKDEELNIKTR